MPVEVRTPIAWENACGIREFVAKCHQVDQSVGPGCIRDAASILQRNSKAGMCIPEVRNLLLLNPVSGDENKFCIHKTICRERGKKLRKLYFIVSTETIICTLYTAHVLPIF
jgi:hypothetical protein